MPHADPNFHRTHGSQHTLHPNEQPPEVNFFEELARAAWGLLWRRAGHRNPWDMMGALCLEEVGGMKEWKTKCITQDFRFRFQELLCRLDGGRVV